MRSAVESTFTWCSRVVNRSFFSRLARSRTRPSPVVTLSRSCARRMWVLSVFPSAPSLRSTGSASVPSDLFAGFPATMEGSDFSCFVHHRLRLHSPPRCGPAVGTTPEVEQEFSRFPYTELPYMPGSSTAPGREALAIARLARVAFRKPENRRHPGRISFSQLNGWPARSPADASPTPSRMPAHGSGPMRFATPSSLWTFTTYSLPVSRRTQVADKFREFVR